MAEAVAQLIVDKLVGVAESSMVQRADHVVAWWVGRRSSLHHRAYPMYCGSVASRAILQVTGHTIKLRGDRQDQPSQYSGQSFDLMTDYSLLLATTNLLYCLRTNTTETHIAVSVQLADILQQ